MTSRIYPRMAALICVLLWSSISVVAKLGQTSLDFYQFLFLSNIFSVFAVGIAALLSRRSGRALLLPGWQSLWHSIVLGVLDCLFYLALYHGYAWANGMAVLVVQYSWPLMIVALTSLRDRRFPGWAKSLGLALGLCAIIVTVTKGHFTELAWIQPGVILIVLAGAFCFALMSTLSKSFVDDPFIGTFWLFISSTVASFVLSTMWSAVPPLSALSDPMVLFNGLLVNGLSYILWIFACKHGDASETASLVLLSPVLSVLWLNLLFHGHFLPAYLVSLVLVVGSGFLCLAPQSWLMRTRADPHRLDPPSM